MHEQATMQRSMLNESANGRFKRSFSSWFWGSMITATVAHFGFFAFLEFGEVPDVSVHVTPVALTPPPEVPIPPPPDAISRPATPVVATVAIDDDVTIDPVTFDRNPPDRLPPPPDEVETNITDAPGFSVYTVAPRYTNVDEVRRALEREYPPLLRDAGIGGTVLVWFRIDESGVVRDQMVHAGSGHPALDEAALRVAPVFRFTPALNRDRAVPVWVSLPITFRAN